MREKIKERRARENVLEREREREGSRCERGEDIKTKRLRGGGK